MYPERLKPFIYGLLAIAGLVGIATLVWSAIPQGAPVLYTAPDTATVPILISPDLRSTGAFSATGSLLFSGFISPTQLTGTVNDYNPGGTFATSSVLRLTSSTSVTLTGLIAGSHGTWKVLYNVGSFPIILASESTSSVSANRFALTGNLVIPAGAGVHLQYDQTATPGRWRSASRTFLITSPLAIQNLGSGSIVQHSGRTDAIEIVRIQSSGGTPTNGTNPRILAGVDGQLILLTGMSSTLTYTIPDGNGVKWSTGSSVLFDDRASRLMEYQLDIGAWREAVTGAGGGGGGGGTAAGTSFNPTGGIQSANVQTGMAELDSEAEKLANKNLANGYMGLTATGDLVWDKDGYAAEPALSASSAIDANTRAVRTIGIENAGAGNLFLNGSANPRITGCTTATGSAGRNGTQLVLRGTHPTKTVTIPTGNGVQLAGNIGSVIVGSLLSPVVFQCDETAQLWVQQGVPSAQQVYNVGRSVSIFTCGNALNPIFDGGSNTTLEFCLDASGRPGWKALVSGAATDNVVQLSVGTKFNVVKSDGTTSLFSVTDAGAVSGLSATPQMLMGGQNLIGGCITSYNHPTMRTFGATAVEVQQIITDSRTIDRLFVRFNSNIPSGQTVKTTYFKNGGATGLTCTVINGAGVGAGELSDQECRDLTHSFSVVAGDLITVETQCTGGIADTPYQQFSANMH